MKTLRWLFMLGAVGIVPCQSVNGGEPSSPTNNPTITVSNKLDSGSYRVLKAHVVQFPDANLEQVIRQTIPIKYSPTNQVYDVDVEAITNLNALNSRIADAAGIEALTGLRTLSIGCNSLSDLNVSACANLETLICYNNNLTYLNVSACINLRTLLCANDQLKKLDVSGCDSLQYLNCLDNDLTTLDLSSNKTLTELEAGHNPLTEIIVWWSPPTNIPPNVKLLYDGNPVLRTATSSAAQPDLLPPATATNAFQLKFKGTINLPDGGQKFQLNLRPNEKTYIRKLGEEVEGFKLLRYEETPIEPRGMDSPRTSWKLTIQRGDKVIILPLGQTVEFTD